MGPWGYGNPQERQEFQFHGVCILVGGDSQYTKEERYKKTAIMRRVVVKLNPDDAIGSNRRLLQLGWQRKGLLEEVTFKFRCKQERSSSNISEERGFQVKGIMSVRAQSKSKLGRLKAVWQLIVSGGAESADESRFMQYLVGLSNWCGKTISGSK